MHGTAGEHGARAASTGRVGSSGLDREVAATGSRTVEAGGGSVHGGAAGAGADAGDRSGLAQSRVGAAAGGAAAMAPRKSLATPADSGGPASGLPLDALSPRQARWRWGEMVALFGVAPAGLAVMSAKAVIPILVVGACIVLVVLMRERTFDRGSLVRVGGRAGSNGQTVARETGRIGAIWLAAIVLLTPAVALATPEEFLSLPRERPLLWAAIMLFYPLLSVYPQEVIFRSFFFHRYGPILGDSARLIAVNALAFGLAHAMFHNGIAVAMTTVGGALFAWTYSRTRSLPLVCLEHALYGCFVFTVGLGEYFYSGAVGA